MNKVIGKQKCGEEKGNSKWSQAYGLICKAWWRCCHGMTVSGTGPLIFTDDFMYDDSSRINLEVYTTILPTNIQENDTRFFGNCFILHQNNDPKHPASSVKEFIRAKKWKVLDCPSQSPDLNPTEHEFHQLKRRVKAETPQNKQQVELAALKAGKVFQRMRPRVWWSLWFANCVSIPPFLCVFWHIA